MKATSQPKPTASEKKVSVNADDLRLIARSNEEGKKAKEQVPVLIEKINVLSKNIAVYEYRIASKDSSLTECASQAAFLSQINANNETIIQNKDTEIANISGDLKKEKRKLRGQRRKTVLVGVAGVVASGAILYLSNK